MSQQIISKTQPTPGDVHVNRPLTNISIATIQSESNFVAGNAFPIVPVQKQSDAYFTYDNAYWNTDEMQLRGPGSEAVGSGYKVDGTTTYFCDPYAIRKDIPDQVRSNADVPLNLDAEATKWVTLKALIKREKLFNSGYLKLGVWTGQADQVGGATASTNVLKYWSDPTSSPIEDVWAAKQSIEGKTGYSPNTLLLMRPVFIKLLNHPEFVDRVKYGQTWTPAGTPARATLQAMADIFELDQVLVMKGVENTANEGAAASHSFIGGGKNAGLFYSPSSPGLMTPSAGYIFSWTGYLGAGSDGNRIKKYRMENLESDRIECQIAFAMKVISADLGAYFSAVIQ